MNRPINFFLSAGQVSDYIGTGALLRGLPDADWLLGVTTLIGSEKRCKTKVDAPASPAESSVGHG